MIELKSYAFETHQGPHLNLNEDLVDIDLQNKLFLVVDGFGGSNIGDRAAKLIRDNIKKSYTQIASDPDATLPFFYSHRYLIEGNALINAFQSAHAAMTKDNSTKQMNEKGGGSVVAAAMAENVLTLISTGNCAAYLFRKGRISIELLPDSLRSLSRDHFSSFMHTVPMSGIGLFEDLQYQVSELKIAKGDIVVLLTDGAYSRLEIDELKYTIENNLEDELLILSEIFKLSNDRGNLDNQSGVVLQF